MLTESNTPGNDVGFFGEVFEVLYQLLNSKRRTGRYDTELAVHWGRYFTWYEEAVGTNAWEYYFTQLFNHESIDPGAERRPAMYGWYKEHNGATWGPLSVHRDGGQRLRAAIQVRHEILGPGLVFDVRLDVKQKLEKYAAELLHGDLHIAVHRRTTDWGHGPVLPTQEFIDVLKPYVDSGYKVLLATDRAEETTEFRHHLGSQNVVTTNACGGVDSKTNKPHTGAACGSMAHHGYEVLQDAYVMSKCQVRLATSSNVSNFVEVLNPAQELDWSLYPTVWGIEFASGVHGELRRKKPEGWPNLTGW